MGVALQTIRQAAKVAAELLEVEHPFAYKKFATDNQTIFLKIEEPEGEKALINLLEQEYWMAYFKDEYLESVEFDPGTRKACRWYPKGKQNGIVLDPKIAFGAPAIESTRLSTETIYSAYLAEQSIETVADWFNVKPLKIEKAIEFEKEMASREIYT